MEQVLDTDTGKYASNFYEKMETVFGLVPDDLGVVVKKSEEMNFAELHGYIQKIESDGYDASGYKVDLYAKLAFPFVCIVLCLTGVGIALRATRREGTGIGIAIGIVTAFLYWIFYSFCLSLGYGEVLPPLIAAWMANLVFLCFAAVMLLHAD
jgi:lipopolysaccharide export system permease protein